MVQVSYPGVYIVEKPCGVRTITSVATSIGAFVGFTRMGLPDKALVVTSLADFEHSHGGLDRESSVSNAVRQFFLNGSNQAQIVRVAVGHATAEWPQEAYFVGCSGETTTQASACPSMTV